MVQCRRCRKVGSACYGATGSLGCIACKLTGTRCDHVVPLVALSALPTEDEVPPNVDSVSEVAVGSDVHAVGAEDPSMPPLVNLHIPSTSSDSLVDMYVPTPGIVVVY
jgi:hypothetical protein